MQVHPIEPKLKPPGIERLKLNCDELLSNLAFKINLRRYMQVTLRDVIVRFRLLQDVNYLSSVHRVHSVLDVPEHLVRLKYQDDESEWCVLGSDSDLKAGRHTRLSFPFQYTSGQAEMEDSASVHGYTG